jgi:hypothetical protein
MTHAVSKQVSKQDGALVGPVVEGRNWSAEAEGSIHNDAVASKLGFRGGTVAGNIHMDQFVPVLLEAYGESWFERGWLSLGFQNATTDREAVCVRASEPSNGSEIDVWMTREDGLEVMRGNAGLGDPSGSALRTRDLRPCDPSELRIISGMSAGLVLGPKRGRIDAKRRGNLLERGLVSCALPEYTGSERWGGPVASPSAIVELLWGIPTQLMREHVGRSVGLFGAIEVAQVEGPLFVDRDYEVRAEIVSVGQSPKTEYVWFDSEARDDEGRLAGTMRMQLRFMKASSPAYATS